MTTATQKRYSEQQIDRYRGVIDDLELLDAKLQWLHDLFLVARDYKVGHGLLDLAHNRVDEAMTILAGALAPWETRIEEDAE